MLATLRTSLTNTETGSCRSSSRWSSRSGATRSIAGAAYDWIVARTERAQVEQSVEWIKEYRRVGTRYDKLATGFQAFINFAMIRRYLMILASDDSWHRT